MIAFTNRSWRTRSQVFYKDNTFCCLPRATRFLRVQLAADALMHQYQLIMHRRDSWLQLRIVLCDGSYIEVAFLLQEGWRKLQWQHNLRAP